MKTNFKRLTSLFVLLLITALLFSSCSPDVDEGGYLTVDKELHWKSIYQVGDQLSLDGLTAKYFSDAEATEFETVTLTMDMISGFDTSKEGDFSLTVTYKGKTDTVDYKVVSKATPFEIVKSFCIAENTVVAIDSTTMKATVSVFDNFFKILEAQPKSTEEKPLSYLVNGSGKTCISFEYGGSRFDIFSDSETSKYHMLTVSLSSGSSSTTETNVTPISADTLQVPQKGALYASEEKDDIFFSIKIDEDYNAVVAKHKVGVGDVTYTILDTFSASDAVLTTSGLFKYSRNDNGYSSSAAFGAQDQFVIRKDSANASEAIHSVLCSLSQ